MMTIRLYGYLNDNFGDDVMVHIILNRYKKFKFRFCDFWPSSDKFLSYTNFVNNDYYYHKYGRVNHILNILLPKRFNNKYINAKLKKIDKNTICSVYIGGSIFAQTDTLTKKRIKYEEEKLNIGPLFIIGANFGPYYDNDFILSYKKFFAQCRNVTFRDTESYSLFSDLKNVDLASDVVLSNFDLPPKSEIFKNYVVFSILDIANKGLGKYKNAYYNLLLNLFEICIQDGKTPCLVSFCSSEGDENAIEEILNLVSEKTRNYIVVIKYKNNINEILTLFESCNSVVATRFHAMILAIKFKKPFFAISYSSKIVNFLNDYKSKAYCEMSDTVYYKAQDIYLNFLKCDTNKIDVNIIDTEGQFKSLDKFLIRNGL